jgi:divinyl protochlorophyllide a 8-vinyl-reductase
MLDAGALHEPKVGPNAIIQTGAALRAMAGREAARAVFARAGLEPWFDAPPEAMVPQDAAAALFDALREERPGDWEAIASVAGRLTAAYLLAYRIPTVARVMLHAAPPRLAGRLLLSAIGRNAWTFAGDGAFASTADDPCVIRITRNPLAQPGCPWHCAVFEMLFRRLVMRRAQVVHTICQAEGDDCCAFRVSLHPNQRKV